MFSLVPVAGKCTVSEAYAITLTLSVQDARLRVISIQGPGWDQPPKKSSCGEPAKQKLAASPERLRPGLSLVRNEAHNQQSVY